MDFSKMLGQSLSPIYRIYGEDFCIIEEVVKEIEKKCNNSMGDLNRSIFNDENFEVNSLLTICNQIPMLADKRIVLVKNMTKISESDIKKINEYAKNPSTDCVLVFVELPNENIFKKINAEQIECKKLPDYQLREIIEDGLKEYNKKITIDAINLIISFCLKDLGLIKNEIFKLGFYEKEAGDVIEASDVKKMVFKNEEYTIYEISDALTRGQGDRAIFLLNKMLESLEFPKIIGLIYSHFRRVYYSVISGGTDLEIAELLGIKPYAVTKSKSTSRHLKPIQISRINAMILEVDYMIKDGKMNWENAMFYLVFGICLIVNKNQ